MSTIFHQTETKQAAKRPAITRTFSPLAGRPHHGLRSTAVNEDMANGTSRNDL
jgi:hypothetical protein